jgi:thioredoxin-related protein
MQRAICLCVLIFVIVACSGLPAQQYSEANQQPAGTTQEVQWLRSASEAARLAKATGKPILVYVRSQNCHHCDLLQQNTWSDRAVKAMIMRDMVPLKLTLEENRDAVILFTPDRQFLAKIDGYLAPSEFESRIAKARQSVAADPNASTRR